MSPSLRSDSPSGKAGDSPTSTTPTSNPRKSPTCKTCGQRRAGHPRTGCPATSSPSPSSKVREPEITGALQSLHIERQTLGDKATIQARRRSSGVKLVQEASLASLSPIAKEAIDRLLQPGIISDELSDDEDQKARIVQWQEMMEPSSIKKSPRSPRIMPGTLHTPTPSFFSDENIPQEPNMACSQVSVATIRASPSTPKPLVRSLSMEERNDFLNTLADTSPTVPATVFQFPINDIPAIQQSAMRLGFFSRVLPAVDGVYGYLILGRDDTAVEGLLESARDQARKRVGNRGSRIGAAAGGAVVGAVATFTGLALS